MRDLKIYISDTKEKHGVLFIEDTHSLPEGTVTPLIYLFYLLLKPESVTDVSRKIIVKEKL